MTRPRRPTLLLGIYRGPPRAASFPTPRCGVRFTPVLSPASKQLAEAVAAQTRLKPRSDAVPPLMEGDIFTSLFEGATERQAGRLPAATPGQAAVPRPSPIKAIPPGLLVYKPVSWSDTLGAGEHAGGLENRRRRL